MVSERLQQFGLVINLEKCVFSVDSFEFLGHIVLAQGPNPFLVTWTQWKKRPLATTIRELQVFLGLVNFSWRFLPGVDVTLLQITDALKGNWPASEKLSWTAEMEASFVAAKATLSRAT
jgi:hypothetical protein